MSRRRLRRPDGGEGTARKLRPLATPAPAGVRTDAEGRPVAVRRRGRFRGVARIRERWRIDDEWWREPLSRLYYEVILENGRSLILYRDRIGGGWYVQGG